VPTRENKSPKMIRQPSLTRRAILRISAVEFIGWPAGRPLGSAFPAEVNSRDIPLRCLSVNEAKCIEAVTQVLVPGAPQAGIANFIDSQLSLSPGDSLLSIKYLDVPPPWQTFYRAAVQWFEEASRKMFSQSVSELPEAAIATLIEAARDNGFTDSTARTSSLFYYVLRSDAVDVVHGTRQGFSSLQLPYLAHVEPVRRW
jgi:hypothetical protein